MNLKSNKPSIAILLTIYCCSVGMAAPQGNVKGRVSDSEGAAIKGAHLVFHPDPSGQSKPLSSADVIGATNERGNFEVLLEPGFYDVCVMATAFTPECGKILVSRNGSVQHDAQLKADALVIKHLGDVF